MKRRIGARLKKRGSRELNKQIKKGLGLNGGRGRTDWFSRQRPLVHKKKSRKKKRSYLYGKELANESRYQKLPQDELASTISLRLKWLRNRLTSQRTSSRERDANPIGGRNKVSHP